MRRVRSAALAVAGLGALACETVIGADFAEVEEVSCDHASPPPPPDLSAPAGGDAVVTVAASDLDLGEGDTPEGPKFLRFGFDLDGVCTNRSQRPSCRPVPWGAPIDTDGLDGRDNAVGWLMHQQVPLFGRLVFRSDDLSEGVRRGTVAPTAVFRVSGYNNRAFDDQVKVEWFVPATPRDGDPEPDWSDPSHAVPLDNQMNGVEEGRPVTRLVDEHAYVNQHVLVARFRGVPIMRLANAAWHLIDAVLVAPIDSEGVASRPGDTATLAGRMTVEELLARLPDVTTFVMRRPICRDDPNYPQVKTYACSVLDLRRDGNDPGAPCDALSFGVQFHLKPVSLGPLRESSPPASCPPGADPREDTCATPPEAP